ncbi:acetyltransferase [Methanobrevibacter sp.]|uniref:acetyltransferase n=1 Tax=Methanobrevibacter sp. TaxID=66852 RepID=UPI0025F80A64|nr:acetyltransferase [Methanobrevibacter sp.]MBQ2832687.1 acetyltransferase [Methanobrevibacter sp.]
METITKEDQVGNLVENKIIGSFRLINSKINFAGANNILVCDNNINFMNANLTFNGDNSLVYICSDVGDAFRLLIYNNSTLFIGKNALFGAGVNINVNESQNVIIGDDGIVSNQVKIFSSDYCAIYDSKTKSRKNFSKGIYIGDHVWLGRYTYISRGVNIGSGSIIGDNSFILPNFKVSSNSLVYGNPARVVDKDVFFTKDFVAQFRPDESLNSQHYKSDVFIFKFVNKETLSIDNIDKILRDLDVESRVEFIRKLFIRNKRSNRFFIQ